MLEPCSVVLFRQGIANRTFHVVHVAAEMNRCASGHDDLIITYITTKLELDQAKRLEMFVGVNAEEQKRNQQEALICAPVNKQLAEVHTTAKDLVSSIPKLQER